ncbi:hypothetical protein Osc1_12500 [Hominimerdicola sp. 21CYCFAH17_S]
MEFKFFAKKLKNVIGGKSNTKIFTKTIFEAMMNESGPELLAGTSPNTFKAYFNGNTSISKVAALILANLSDDDEFPSYLEGFGDTTAQLLVDEFKDDIPDINSINASLKITDLFLEILREASGKEKSTPKSADKPPHDILEEKILTSGQAVTDAWGNAVSNLANGLDGNSATRTVSVQLPEEQPPDEYPYSSEDKLLLQDFTADYDEILLMMIGENYGASLVDMSLPNRVQSLYKTKWSTKADTFNDPTLKSYVFSLLGVLNQLSNCLLTAGTEPFSIQQTRTRIRNLYVKLHPNSFAEAFPYDAFIDDWDDGEFY